MREKKLRIEICNRQRDLKISPKLVREVALGAAPEEWRGATLSVVVVCGGEMTELNRRHTGREGETDVLAFALESEFDAAAGERVVGEIIVNASLAQAEAAARGIEPFHELLLYVAHGTLHIRGYDDHTAADRKAMYAREAEVLARAGIPYPRPVPKNQARSGRKKL